jgi:hypothetical protein
MVDMNMSLPKINCPGDFVIWYYDFVVFHVYVQRNFVTIFLFTSFKSVIDLRVLCVFETVKIGNAHSERLIVFNTP